MGKIRRGGYVFVTWKGDHDPRHVHVFRDGKEILKWNLESKVIMSGKLTSNLRGLIDQLVKERKL
jgi:hypothetical protein